MGKSFLRETWDDQFIYATPEKIAELVLLGENLEVIETDESIMKVMHYEGRTYVLSMKPVKR